MIRFNNDYNRGALESILDGLTEINAASYAGYGEDQWCGRAEAVIKKLIAREDAMIKFVPGATQANIVAIAAALSPADVKSVTLLPGSTKACRVIVPDDQLSLAIGKEGQNARLAARLTGYKIDIKPASQEQELEAIDAQPDAAPEDAEPQA